jgi:hypothetical protein
MSGREYSVGFQRLAEEGDGLGDRRAGDVSLADRVEHHEVVMDAVVANGRDRDPGTPELCGVGLALVALGRLPRRRAAVSGGSPLSCSTVARFGDAVISWRAAGAGI